MQINDEIIVSEQKGSQVQRQEYVLEATFGQNCDRIINIIGIQPNSVPGFRAYS